MRRLALIVLALMVCSIASAVPINPTIDWYTSQTPYRHYNTAYNPSTGHIITNNRYFSTFEKAIGYNPQLSIWSSADGSYIKGTAFADGSSPFSLTCTTDGVLYGADLSIGEVVQMWADENTSPGVLMPAPGLSFSRGANVRGTSTSPTLYMACGSSDLDKGQILQLDATLTTWSVVSTIPAPFCKAGIAVRDRDTLLGMGPWMDDGDTSPALGFPDVRRNRNPGSWAYANWVRDDVFNPEDATVGGWSNTIGGDYADGLYWVLLYWDARIVAYDAVHGTILASMPVPTWGYLSWGKPAILYYGGLITEEGGAPNNTVYWGSRLYNAGYNGALGKLTYTEPKPVINEVDYDQAGSPDTAEFVEIWGVPGTDISSYTLSVVNGADGSETAVATIPPGTTIPDDAFYVIGMAGVPNVDLVVGESLQNGAPDAVVLRDYPGGTVIDALGYEMGGSGGAASLPAWSYEDAGYKSGDNFGSKFSLGRKADAVDTDNNQVDFDVMWPTPGEKNRQFTLWSSEMPYVDSFPAAGPELPWKSDFFPIRSIDPDSVGAPDSPEDSWWWYWWWPSPSADSVGRCDDPAGGGQINLLGDHNFAQRNINIQAWVYTGVELESIGLFVRGVGDTGWRATTRSAGSSSGYENCYAIEWYDDGTSTCLRAIKMLVADDSLTYFAADSTGYNAPGWHHLRIFANGTYVITYVDSVKFSEVTDTDITSGYVGIGFREARPGAALVGGLVDSIIIDNNFSYGHNEMIDWDLY